MFSFYKIFSFSVIIAAIAGCSEVAANSNSYSSGTVTIYELTKDNKKLVGQKALDDVATEIVGQMDHLLTLYVDVKMK